MNDFEALVKIYNTLKHKYMNERKFAWENSPFAELIPTFGIKDTGIIGEAMIFALMELYGISVKTALVNNDDYDLMINGKRIEIKFATQSKVGVFTANQIRDQNYDYMLIIGLSPNNITYWLFDKAKAWEIGSFQHGKSEIKDTKIITVTPTKNRRTKFTPYEIGHSFSDVLKRLI